MGHFIRHIHNRDLASENIMTAYVRLQVMMASAPGSIKALLARLKDAGLDLGADRRSHITLATEVMQFDVSCK